MAGYEQTRTKLLYINKGRLCFKTSAGEWDSHGAWDGFLTDIQFKTVTPKDNTVRPYEALNITLHDGYEEVVITCKFNSGYGKAFARIIGNADLTKKIAIVPTYKEENGQKQSGLFIQQGTGALKWYFTRDNPKGMPSAQEIEVNGDKMLNWTDQLNFLRNYLLTEIKPKLTHPALLPTTDIQPKPVNSTMKPVVAPLDGEEPEDDLPF